LWKPTKGTNPIKSVVTNLGVGFLVFDFPSKSTVYQWMISFLEKKQDQMQHIISEETSHNTGVHLKACRQTSLLRECSLVSGFVTVCNGEVNSFLTDTYDITQTIAKKKTPKITDTGQEIIPGYHTTYC
jgi:hypothetical protein